MTEKTWQVLVELDQRVEPGSDQKVMESLAKALSELRLPAAFLDRLKTAVTGAVSRAIQRHGETNLNLSVSVQVSDPGVVSKGTKNESWGFFLVEKGMEAGTNSHIGLFLYRER